MIKLKSLLKEQTYNLGGMKTSVQLVDVYYSLHQNERGDIYAYPQDQTRLVKALDRFGEKAVIEILLNKINNRYGDAGFYLFQQGPIDPTKPLVFLYVPNDQA
jgi:hypothetical protein